MSDVLKQGYLALPAGTETAPAVLILPAWWGLNSFFKELCDRLAQSGFVVFAPDVHGGKVAKTIPEAEALRDAQDDTVSNQQIQTAAEALRQHPRANGQALGVVGFSMGAYQALNLLYHAPDLVGAVVLFYGTGYLPDHPLHVPVLGHFAASDPYESAEYIEQSEKALAAAGAPTTFHTYPDTGHWFFESNQPESYEPTAAALAWERTLTFLQENL